MNASGIYEILNLVNGKRYIGSAVYLRRRWGVHRRALRKGSHHSRALQRAWIKYGSDAFVFKPLLICAAKDLIFYEDRCFDGYKPEYNICPTAGSSLGVHHSSEARSKISLANIGRPCSPATRAKLRGNQNSLGCVPSPKTRAKLSAARIGNQNGAGNLGKPKSAEHRANIGAGLLGNQNLLGHKASPETRANMRAAQTLRREQERRV